MRSISARKRGKRTKTYTITHYALCNPRASIIYHVARGWSDLVIVEFYFLLKKFYHPWLLVFTYNNLYLMDRLKSKIP